MCYTVAMDSFSKELKNLINAHSKERASNTPDYILAMYLERCLETFGIAVTRRDIHEGRITEPSARDEPDIDGHRSRVKLGASANPFYDTVRRGADDQLTQCMPAELRGGLWDGRFPKLPVEGHDPDCKIDLAWEWTPCTCEAGL